MRGVKGESVELICDYCGKKFMRETYMLSKSGKYFCSHSCVGKYYGESGMGNIARWGQERRKTQCQCYRCGKIFLKSTYAVFKRNFCSWKCWLEQLSEDRRTKPMSESWKKHIGEAITELFANFEYRQWFSEIMGSPEVTAKLSQRAREQARNNPEQMWKTLEIMWKASLENRKPNKPEKELMEIVEQMRSGEYEYNYGQWKIGNRFPDLVNINGRKKLIELFGDYWHAGEDPQDKINFYKSLGWDCLVIWEHELKVHNRRGLLAKLEAFL